MGCGNVSPSASKKAKKCSFFKSRKDGRWTKMVCTLPEGMTCPNPLCQANPDFQEPEPHGGE